MREFYTPTFRFVSAVRAFDAAHDAPVAQLARRRVLVPPVAWTRATRRRKVSHTQEGAVMLLLAACACAPHHAYNRGEGVGVSSNHTIAKALQVQRARTPVRCLRGCVAAAAEANTGTFSTVHVPGRVLVRELQAGEPLCL